MNQAAKRYKVFETAMGFCAIAWSGAGVARFQLPMKGSEAAERLMRRRVPLAEPRTPPEDVAAVVAAAKRYFGGEETDFSQVRLDLGGEDPFFSRIYGALRRVGWGRNDYLWRLSQGGRRQPRGGARRWRGDGQESGSPGHSMSPRSGRRRQDRRFLGARRLDDEDPDAGTRGRSRSAAGGGPTFIQFLTGRGSLRQPSSWNCDREERSDTAIQGSGRIPPPPRWLRSR